MLPHARVRAPPAGPHLDLEEWLPPALRCAEAAPLRALPLVLALRGVTPTASYSLRRSQELLLDLVALPYTSCTRAGEGWISRAWCGSKAVRLQPTQTVPSACCWLPALLPVPLAASCSP